LRDPASLRSFVDDPEQALEEAGLPDATPGRVHDPLPAVAESMPPRPSPRWRRQPRRRRCGLGQRCRM